MSETPTEALSAPLPAVRAEEGSPAVSTAPEPQPFTKSLETLLRRRIEGANPPSPKTAPLRPSCPHPTRKTRTPRTPQAPKTAPIICPERPPTPPLAAVSTLRSLGKVLVSSREFSNSITSVLALPREGEEEEEQVEDAEGECPPSLAGSFLVALFDLRHLSDQFGELIEKTSDVNSNAISTIRSIRGQLGSIESKCSALARSSPRSSHFESPFVPDLFEPESSQFVPETRPSATTRHLSSLPPGPLLHLLDSDPLNAPDSCVSLFDELELETLYHRFSHPYLIYNQWLEETRREVKRVWARTARESIRLGLSVGVMLDFHEENSVQGVGSLVRKAVREVEEDGENEENANVDPRVRRGRLSPTRCRFGESWMKRHGVGVGMGISNDDDNDNAIEITSSILEKICDDDDVVDGTSVQNEEENGIEEEEEEEEEEENHLEPKEIISPLLTPPPPPLSENLSDQENAFFSLSSSSSNEDDEGDFMFEEILSSKLIQEEEEQEQIQFEEEEEEESVLNIVVPGENEEDEMNLPMRSPLPPAHHMSFLDAIRSFDVKTLKASNTKKKKKRKKEMMGMGMGMGPRHRRAATGVMALLQQSYVLKQHDRSLSETLYDDFDDDDGWD